MDKLPIGDSGTSLSNRPDDTTILQRWQEPIRMQPIYQNHLSYDLGINELG
jgi:hypothetical protein